MKMICCKYDKVVISKPLYAILKPTVKFMLKYCPIIRHPFQCLFYNLLSGDFEDSLRFINWGYVTKQTDKASLNRLSEQLYKHVIGDIILKDKKILEIGCGRGGGSGIIYDMGNRSYTGVDISEKSLSFCRAMCPYADFKYADALHLPFDDGSFDVVINVESAHLYQNKEKFLDEVVRVLKPGAYFLYADIGNPEVDGINPEMMSQMLRKRFEVIEANDIRENVLLSRRVAAESDLLKSLKNKKDLNRYREILGFAGTVSFEKLSSGKFQYWSYKLRKQKRNVYEV